jgi:lactoylglutathione lyase
MEPVSSVINLLVIRSANLDRATTFYETIGLKFIRHAHAQGPEHYVSEMNGFIFEIYPERDAQDTTINTRIGFKVDNVDQVLELLQTVDVKILIAPVDTKWGRRAVVQDFDGHTIELITPYH